MKFTLPSKPQNNVVTYMLFFRGHASVHITNQNGSLLNIQHPSKVSIRGVQIQ